MRAGATLLGRVLVGLAGMALVTALCLFALAGYVLTWPYRRQPRRARVLRAGVQAAVSVSALVAVLRELQDERGAPAGENGPPARTAPPFPPH